MATITGNDGQVVISGTTLAAVRNFSVEMTADTIETTTMGVDVRTYITGLSAFSGSADVYFDAADFDTYESGSYTVKVLNSLGCTSVSSLANVVVVCEFNEMLFFAKTNSRADDLSEL
jgi:hypothetical protein